MDTYGLSLRIDDDNGAHASAQPLARLFFDLTVSVRWRHHFKDRVRRSVVELGGTDDSLRAYECGIGASDGVRITRNPETGIRRVDPPKHAASRRYPG
jgi:hypothetical protein